MDIDSELYEYSKTLTEEQLNDEKIKDELYKFHKESLNDKNRKKKTVENTT